TNAVLKRKGRTFAFGGAEDPLGGSTTPFVTLEGEGRLILGAPERFGAWVSTLDGEPFYTREERLLGFDGSLQHTSGRMTLAGARNGAEGTVAALVQLTGSGFVALGARGTIHGIDVSASRPIEVRAGQIVAWVGRLIPRAVPREEAPAGLLDLVALSGTGVVLVDGG
ncbi:MAG TPA: AIM24 family protein, partial [Polyangiaceae bacterium]